MLSNPRPTTVVNEQKSIIIFIHQYMVDVKNNTTRKKT